MKTGIKILIAFIVILAIAWGVYWLGPKRHSSPAPIAPSSTMTYACTEGALKASYSATQVNLTLADGTTMILPQVLSGSGTRYEKGDMTLITKGDYAFLQQGDATIYSNCVLSTDIPAGTGMQTFTDGSQTFSFMHPSDVTISGGDIGYTQDWRVNTQTLGLLLVKATLPSTLQPKTNFAGATFTVGTSSDPDTIKNCTLATNGEHDTGTVTLQGITYHKITLSDAGAGNFYDTTSYRTLHNSQCYAIEYTIHSTNIGNYSPDQGITQFDKQSVTNELDAMAKSFTFLQ
ncbi:MAG TPA: MliC family protein [Candidatus Paceibacterota bacterium]|nr:MliC family protein [Candidatus Paceibacterota bacterium]